MDELALADTETTGNYLTLDLPCEINQLAFIPLSILMPNRKIITSTHTELLSKTDLPIEARKAHLFPGLNKSFLSIGKCFDHGCQAVPIYSKDLLRPGKICAFHTSIGRSILESSAVWVEVIISPFGMRMGS